MFQRDWVGVVGIILSVIAILLAIFFGIPIASGNRALEVLLAFILVVLFIVVFYFQRMISLPPFTVIANHHSVEIQDPHGHETRWRKTITIRPNHRGLNTFTHRNISCDGSVSNFRVDPNVTLLNTEVIAGDHAVTVRFHHQPPPFRETTTWIEADFTDVFTAKQEGFILLADQRLKVATIQITFPQSRLPHEVRAIFRYAGTEEPLPLPSVLGNQVTWSRTARVRGLPLGEYEIAWHW
jgi:hypothetical protein